MINLQTWTVQNGDCVKSWHPVLDFSETSCYKQILCFGFLLYNIKKKNQNFGGVQSSLCDQALQKKKQIQYICWRGTNVWLAVFDRSQE